MLKPCQLSDIIGLSILLRKRGYKRPEESCSILNIMRKWHKGLFTTRNLIPRPDLLAIDIWGWDLEITMEIVKWI